MNGYDAAQSIRKQPWGRDVVIVALNGWGLDRDRLRSKEAVIDGHLVKPVDRPSCDPDRKPPRSSQSPIARLAAAVMDVRRAGNLPSRQIDRPGVDSEKSGTRLASEETRSTRPQGRILRPDRAPRPPRNGR
jgi:hypothetical protein